MPAFPYPSVSNQPRGVPKVRTNSPFVQGLVSALVPRGYGFVDAAQSRNLAPAPNGTITSVYGDRGIGLRYGDAGGAAFCQYNLPTTLTGASAGTIVWVGQRNASGPAIFRDNTVTTTGTLLWDDGAGAFNVRVNGTTTTSVGSFPQDTTLIVVLTGDATDSRLYVNGRLVTTLAVAWSLSTSTFINLHQNTGNGQGVLATDFLWLMYSRKLGPAEVGALSANPWQVFSSQTRRILLGVAGAAGVSGTSSQQLGAFTASAAGTVAVAGSASRQLGLLTASASGAVSISGSGAATLSPIAQAAAAAVAVAGSSSATLGTFTQSAVGSVLSGVTGSQSQTLAAITASAAAAVTVSGTQAQALASIPASGAGAVAVAAAQAQALQGVAQASAASVAVTGAAAAALAPVGQQANGVVGTIVSGAASASLDAFTQASAATVVDGSPGAGSSSRSRRGRYAVEHRGRLMVFDNERDFEQAVADIKEADRRAEEARQRAIAEQRTPKQVRRAVRSARADAAASVPATAAAVVPLDEVQAFAQVQGLLDSFRAAMQSREYERVLAMFEQARQADEEDVELLLLMET